ncbi:TPA: hypothetical protein ACF5BZ_002673 [Vibrio parahaemolyticus]
MGILKSVIANSNFVSGLKQPMSANAINLMAYSDGTAFCTELNVAKLAVIEQYDDQSGFKKTYLIEEEVSKVLDSKCFAVKNLHIMCSLAGEIRFSLITDKPTNSWNRSKLEGLVASSKGKAVSFTRDPLAKVYAHTVEHDVTPIDINMEEADVLLTETFKGEFTISSMDHPVIKKLLENNERGVVVARADVDKAAKQNDADAKKSVERLPEKDGNQKLDNSLKNEIELEDIHLEDENGLGLDDMNI